MRADEIEAMIVAAIPDARVEIRDLAGDGDHYAARVIAESFAGMVDRVMDGIGRLGPVDDAEALARNILDVWHADHQAMGQAAHLHARQYSWDRSMSDLFGSLYPKAFRRAWTRATAPAAKTTPALADA